MKKPLSILLSAAMLLSYAAISPGASAETTDAAYEKKEIAAQSNIEDKDVGSFTCLLRSDLPEIPYVKADDYIGLAFNSNSAESKGSGVYTISNSDYTMTLDAEKDIVSFDLYEGFLFSNRKYTTEFSAYPFIESGNGMSLVGDAKGVELDLSKYNIDVVEEDGSVYLPFCTLNDIFSIAGCTMTYKKDKLTMNNSDSMGSKGSFPESRTKEYAKFVYDEFCFAIDEFHGKPSNAIITDSIAKIGFDKTLDTFNTVTPKIKELLLSDSTEDYCTALALLNYYMADGGHTSIIYSISDRLSKYGITDAVSAAEKVYGKDTTNPDAAEIIASKAIHEENNKMARDITASKNDAFKNFEMIKDWKVSKLHKSGDTYIFEIFNFSAYLVNSFKEAMDYAAEHNAKNFVLYSNAGGDPIAAVYMISLMSDNAAYSEKFVTSGNVTVFDGKIDKNLDGKYDEKDDEVKYNFRCAVLANKNCYSCGHIYVGIAKDSGVCVLGEQTSGGSCSVTSRMLPNGTAYNASGYSMYQRKDGTDPDAGIIPDHEMPGADKEYKGFFDIKEINKAIAEFYGDPIPQDTGIYGDLTDDGYVNSADALFVLRMSIGLEEKTEERIVLADVDDDKDVTSADALAILRYSVGLGDNKKIAAGMHPAGMHPQVNSD